MSGRPALRDPQHHEKILALGLEIGFGALMSGAEAAWREQLQKDGDPVGGEFVCGTCRVLYDKALKQIEAALCAPLSERNNQPSDTSPSPAADREEITGLVKRAWAAVDGIELLQSSRSLRCGVAEIIRELIAVVASQPAPNSIKDGK